MIRFNDFFRYLTGSSRGRYSLVLLACFGLIPVFNLACLASAQSGPAPDPNAAEALDFSPYSQRMFRLSDSLPSISLFTVLGYNTKLNQWNRIQTFCQKLDEKYVRYGWKKSPCLDLPWKFKRVSERGEPLVYWEYSNLSEATTIDETGTTLVLGGVHPDEITPIHVSFRFANALNLFPEIYKGRRVIIAPLVNPDGFFVDKPTRTNANGVDLNRNLPTQDWWARAMHHWEKNRGNDKRHFPGTYPGSEEGTRFQTDLIAQFDPDKVISIHAPLGFLDYDGPGDRGAKSVSHQDRRARELVFTMSKTSRNYRIKEFPIYPGSLGNFSGEERAIPTVTLELDSTDPSKVQKFWREFYPGLKTAIKFDFRKRFLARLDDTCLSTFCLNTATDPLAPVVAE